MTLRVRVEGHDVVVERPYGPRPRLLVGDDELPRDRFGRYVLTAADGSPRPVETSFDLKNLALVLRVGDQRVPTVPSLPRATWFVLAPLLVLSLFGGGLGAGLGVTSVLLAAQRLRPSPGRRAGWAGALAILLLALLLYGAGVALLHAVV